MRSSWFGRAVLKETGGHPTLSEAAPEARLRLAGDREQNDTLALERKVDGRSGMEADPVPQILRDHDLALRPDSVNHTVEV